MIIIINKSLVLLYRIPSTVCAFFCCCPIWCVCVCSIRPKNADETETLLFYAFFCFDFVFFYTFDFFSCFLSVCARFLVSLGSFLLFFSRFSTVVFLYLIRNVLLSDAFFFHCCTSARFFFSRCIHPCEYSNRAMVVCS